MSEGFVSLMYHNVVSDDAAGTRADMAGLSPSITGYFVAADRFARQLDAVKRVAEVMTFNDLRDFYSPSSERAAANPRPQVQLTFDDGWRGSVDVAGPLLAERGLQALLFVTTGLLERPHFLTTADLAQLPQETFHVGSHTVTHPFLNELDESSITEELRRSKSTLEDIVGYEVDCLSIPNGAVDDRVIRIAEDCGYRFVCVSSVHRNTARRGPSSIGRVAIRSTTSVETVERLARGDLHRERFRATVLSVPKQVLGPSRYRRLRGILLGEAPEAQEMCDLMHLGEADHQTPPAQSTSGSRYVVTSGIKP
jgi:peptidoglycan/xylan/chitin deacetylase (PgdA/CDA1 family)